MSTLLSHGGNVLCALSVVLVFLGPSASAGVVDDIVADVDQASYTTYHSSLYTSTGDNRGLNGNEHTLARDYIFNTWTGLGLNTSLDPFTHNSSPHNNVVAIQPGMVTPNQYYVVGGHYDSLNNPGADDNASGVAGVMEAALVLSEYEFESSLIYIAFDCEEQGLIGSGHYASDHSTDDIQSMISMDMIAYNPAGANYNTAFIYYDTDHDTSLTAGLADSLWTHGGITTTIGKMGRSDHESFDNVGFSAALLIEPYPDSNPHYHKSTDAMETAGLIDYAYATNMTRGVVGYLATSAVYYEATALVPEPSSFVLAVLALASLVGWAARRRRRLSDPT